MSDFLQDILVSRKELFWDKAALDPEKDRYVIVERVLEFGTEREAREVVSRFGEAFIREVVRTSRNLSPKTANYFSRLLHIPREDIRCFSAASPQTWQPF